MIGPPTRKVCLSKWIFRKFRKLNWPFKSFLLSSSHNRLYEVLSFLSRTWAKKSESRQFLRTLCKSALFGPCKHARILQLAGLSWNSGLLLNLVHIISFWKKEVLWKQLMLYTKKHKWQLWCQISIVANLGHKNAAGPPAQKREYKNI